MKHGSCSGCGMAVRYFTVRLCGDCVGARVELETVDPYGHLLPPGQSFYDPEGWPLPSGAIWTADDTDPRPSLVWA